MLPEEIYASSGSSANFKYTHPLSHETVDDGSMRARLAYDLMTFMERSDCNYFLNPENAAGYHPQYSDDEVDIMIIDGYYKEAEIMINQRLADDPDDEKALFQKAFIQHLQEEYTKLLNREDRILASDPKNVNALINKGFALANLSREEEALKVADKALSVDPDNLMALSNKAQIAKLLGKDELREQTLQQAYNVSAKHRMAKLQQEESKLLRDFESVFMAIESTQSPFDEFNQKSGYAESTSIH